jgi:G3E family GTPase
MMPHAPAPAGPEFVVLTGFLGSGKTTLLRDYLASPQAADTAVIVNEVGEIGLDGAILRETGGAVPMAMMANGCVCCQVGSDLEMTVDALLAADRPGAEGPLRRIILETSGLSKPGPVLRQLATLGHYRMRVSVVATYDAVRGTGTAS